MRQGKGLQRWVSTRTCFCKVELAKALDIPRPDRIHENDKSYLFGLVWRRLSEFGSFVTSLNFGSRTRRFCFCSTRIEGVAHFSAKLVACGNGQVGPHQIFGHRWVRREVEPASRKTHVLPCLVLLAKHVLRARFIMLSGPLL